MKKFYFVWVLALVMACFTACTKEEYIFITSPEVEEDKSTYTIMMYGCGGGNLDRAMILNIQEALLEGSSDRVQFTGQIKFSARFQETEEFSGTQRFIVGTENDTWYTPVEVLDGEMKLYDPQNIADFITWSKEQCPADEYILLLWNHGSAWLPKYDTTTSRAIVHDDNHNSRAITLDELVAGITASRVKMKMIYFDACLMGMAEVLAGLDDCSEYVLCASHVTPGMGGDYNSLIYNLNNSTNFESAINEYGREVMAHWNNQGLPLDLKLVNLGKMDNLMANIKTLSGYLEDVAQITAEYKEDVKNGVQINPYDDRALIAEIFEYAVNRCYCYIWEYKDGVATYPFYDLHMFTELLTCGDTHSYSARFVDIASRINRSMKEAIVFKHSSTISGALDFSMGVTIVSKDTWTKHGYDTTYNGLKFDQLTSWGKWLSKNPLNPTGNPNPMTIIGANGGNEGEGEGEGEGEDGEDGEDGENGEEEITLEEEIEQMLNLIGRN